ncbi:MAG: tetratricopeptide repeat protein [Myxococcales bacterium]|nr:tetratricopeptide repeat protein [Myxococcales bacterium]
MKRRQIPGAGRIRAGLALFVLGLPLAAPASAAPAGDDWAIERDDRQPALVEQRFAKLRKNPFDSGQWRALEKALGKGGLAKKIEAAAKRSPEDVGLGILEARLRLARGEPRAAAKRLEGLRERAGRWRGRVIGLEVDAWIAASDPRPAIALLEKTAAGDRKALERAYELADRNQLRDDALRLAQALDRGDLSSKLRVARAALAAGATEPAEAAFAAATKAAPAKQRPAIQHEWARAKLRANDPVAAADLLWRAIDGAGSEAERESLFATLADCHTRDVSGTLDLARLEAWLATPKHSKEAAAWRTLARLEALQGRDPIPSWRKAIAADPRDRESQAALLAAIEATGDADATAAELRRIGATKDPEHAQLALEIASRMIANGHRDLGLEIAAEVEANASRSTATLIGLLDFFNLNDETDHALEIAERLVKLRPRDPEARIALGEQLYQMRREADALREWEMLPKLIRPSHRGWARQAEILAEHRHPHAITALQKALAAAPNEPTYLRLQALLEQESRVPQRALTSWQEILKRADKPEQRLLRDEARTRVVDLLVSGSSGKIARRRRTAEENARRELDAGSPDEQREAGLFLAELYARQERYEEAVQIHERLLALAPEDPERLAALALAQRRAGQSEAAMATLERLVAVDPKRSSDVLSELAEMAFGTGDLDRALEAATKAAAAGADSSRAIVRLGELYERRGDPEAAAKTYRKALEIAPGDPLARLRLAELALASGDTAKATALFRKIVESGGPPEITQQAGRRALDLAEASANTLAVVELALLRAQREPASEEPRELLLDALDRSDGAKLRAWLRERGEASRASALRRVLVYSLNRDSVGTRLRAAEHLGALELPGSAVPLARIGAQLTPPRDAPRPVKDAYAQARATALFAAGAQEDPEALPIYRQVVANRSAPVDVRYAAAWSALRAAPRTEPLDLYLGRDADNVLLSLTCLAIARDPSRVSSPKARELLDQRASGARNVHQKHACAMAVAATRGDPDLKAVIAALDSSDPHEAAIAAWRLGHVSTPTDAVVGALLRRYLGPKGLGRDAAAAALARLLGDPAARHEAPLPRLQQRGWEMSVTRWLIEETAPSYAPLRPADLRPWHAALRDALEAAKSGTRAERVAYRAATSGCGDGRGGEVCLGPLVRGTIALATAQTKKANSGKTKKPEKAKDARRSGS